MNDINSFPNTSILIVGDDYTGKTTLINRFLGNYSWEDYRKTLENEYYTTKKKLQMELMK